MSNFYCFFKLMTLKQRPKSRKDTLLVDPFAFKASSGDVCLKVVVLSTSLSMYKVISPKPREEDPSKTLKIATPPEDVWLVDPKFLVCFADCRGSF